MSRTFFVTATKPGGAPTTFSRQAATKQALQSELAKEFGQRVSFRISEVG